MKLTKLIFIAITIGILPGCIWNKRTEYVDVYKPILVCPPPPRVAKPNLYINHLVDADVNDPGKVAQYSRLTIMQLHTYSTQLELILGQYVDISKNYEKIKADAESANKQTGKK